MTFKHIASIVDGLCDLMPYSACKRSETDSAPSPFLPADKHCYWVRPCVEGKALNHSNTYRINGRAVKPGRGSA